VAEASHAVFLSYASQDTEAAQKICEALRAAGIEVWFDQSELRGGDAWDRKIRDQIRHCSLFIPIISAHSQARLEGYFRREWKFAVERKRDIADELAFLLPVVIDETPERGASVPEGFHEVQWTRLPGGAASQEFIQHVSRLLTGHQDHPPKPVVQAPQPSLPPAPTRPAAGSKSASSRRMWTLLIAAAAAAIVAYIGIDRYVLHRNTHPPVVPATSAMDKSIAVLPFADLSEKHDQEYFADGMAEEIINLLTKIPGLKVIGRTSSFQFKEKAEDLRQIGNTLGAAYLVEGSVRRSGTHVRVTAQLIEARDGTHRWSETYDREARDALTVQDEITAGLVRALQLEVIGGASGVKPRTVPRNPEAYDAYLRGLHSFNRFDEAGLDEAAADFNRALELDPVFVPAAEQLARTLCGQPTWGFVPSSVGFEHAREAAISVLKLDSHSAVGHTVLACVHLWYDWDWAAALKETTIAMTQATPDAFTLFTASIERMAAGQWKEAIRIAGAAMAVDPLQPSAYENINWAYLRSGRFAEAEAAARRVLQISPTYTGAHRDLGNALLMQGKAEEALTEMQKETFVGWQQVGLVLANQALHRAQNASAELARLEAEHSADMAMGIAEAYAFNGQKDQAFSWLDKAYAQKDIFLWSIKGDPFFKNLEGDPRYKSFLRKMNLPE
jgi:TolB-like protein